MALIKFPPPHQIKNPSCFQLGFFLLFFMNACLSNRCIGEAAFKKVSYFSRRLAIRE